MQVKLVYGRHGTTYSGKLMSDKGHCERINEIPFAQMMSRLAELVRTSSEDDVVELQRIETEGSIFLDKDTVCTLKSNPTLVIQSMIYPDRVIKVRDQVKPTDVVRINLRSGRDALADAFGEEVYCKRMDKKIECPVTGRFKYLSRAVRHMTDSPEPMFVIQEIAEPDTNPPFATNAREIGPFFEAGNSWLTIHVESLLYLNEPRYYLPRAWNKTKGWISHSELKQMYEQFIKEKEKCKDDNKA